MKKIILPLLVMAFMLTSAGASHAFFLDETDVLLNLGNPSASYTVPKDDILENCEDGLLGLTIGYYYFGSLDSSGGLADEISIMVEISNGAELFSGVIDTFEPQQFPRDNNPEPKLFETCFDVPGFETAETGLEIVITALVTGSDENIDLDFVALDCKTVPVPAPLFFLGAGVLGLMGLRRKNA